MQTGENPMKKSRIALLLIIVSAVTCAIVLHGIIPPTYDIEVGKASPEDIYSLRDIVDKVTTESKKKAAEDSTPVRYADDTEATENSKKGLESFTNTLKDARKLYREEKDIEKIIQNLGIDRDLLQKLITFEEKDFNSFMKSLSSLQTDLLEKGVQSKEQALKTAKEKIAEDYGDEKAEIAFAILSKTLNVNKKLDSEATQRDKEAARASVSDVTYKQNQVIVRRGDIVTEAHFQLLTEMGLVKSSQSGLVRKSIGVIVLVLFAVYFAIQAVKREEEDIQESKIVLLCIIFVFTMLLTLLGSNSVINSYLVPLSLSAALCSVIFGVRLALCINIPVIILGGLALCGNAYYFGAAFLSSVISVLVYSKAELRTKLVKSSLINCGLYAFIFAGAALCEGLEINNILLRALYGVANSFITSLLLIGILPFLETVFNITTAYKLSELTNPNQPLLKKLLLEAPGTYHHSLMVGNLAEAACNAIGGNAILARAGAYYHDIGKLKRPIYFAENQYSENPHDKLTPELSASTIISHVTDGEELAKEYRLPAEIKRIIKAHHGTSVVAYFYHKAKKISESGIVDKEKYTYKNILPKTKEEVSVMLADSVEAAVRSLDDKSEENVRKTVSGIIDSRLSEGQLSESCLTLSDIEKIKEAFIKTLCGYFHNRVKYPEEKKEEKNEEQNTDNK